MPSGFVTKLSLGFRTSIIARNSGFLSSNSSSFSARRCLSRFPMAASGSKAVFGDTFIGDMNATCGNGLEFSKPSSVFFVDRSRASCLTATVRLRNEELPNSRLVCGYSSIDAITRGAGSSLKNFHKLSSAKFSARAAHDEPLANSTMISGQALKLLSGACYLPHPDKEETGGEDAHFVCEDEQVIGVADGVGGWADVGINSGLYSRELMSNSVSAILEEPVGSIDPAMVLMKAHSKTKAQGSSTACIIALKNEKIHAINLGDSGFMVVRNGRTVFQSPVQQHSFNFTYQLDSSGAGDPPSSGQVFTFPVSSGDVIVAGTDGLFDNLYNTEITSAVVQAIRAGFGPQATAEKIASLARERALDRKFWSPFAKAAQDAGFRYDGGKLDDTTVVVSFVTNS